MADNGTRRFERMLPTRIRRKIHDGHLVERNGEKLMDSTRLNRHIDQHESHVIEPTDLTIDFPYRGMMDCHCCGYMGPYDRQRFQKREHKALKRLRRGVPADTPDGATLLPTHRFVIHEAMEKPGGNDNTDSQAHHQESDKASHPGEAVTEPLKSTQKRNA